MSTESRASRPKGWKPGIKRFIILRTPEGHEPGTFFPEEYELEWFDREECGLMAKIIVIHPNVLCRPVGIKLRRKSDGAIADVYEPFGAPPKNPPPRPAVK